MYFNTVWPSPCALGTRKSFSNYAQKYIRIISVFTPKTHTKNLNIAEFWRKATANSEIVGYTKLKEWKKKGEILVGLTHTIFGVGFIFKFH